MYDLYPLRSCLNFHARYILVNFWRRDVYFLNKCFIRGFYRFNRNRALHLAGRLKAEEKQRVIDMTKSLAAPRKILTDLMEKNKESVTLIKQVYNAHSRRRKGQREDKTKLQYLISKLEKHQYVYFTRANSEETTLEDLFFAHPSSINMLNTFPTILVMESTYKTNTYRMPLFEIVGVTSTKLTYSVAFAFLSFEQENNFIWALEMLVGVLTSKRNIPKVIVTDRDPALMKVDAEVLPKTDHVLCYFHIEKNVKSRCITNCRVNAKPSKAKVVGKDVKEADDDKHCELVKKIVRAWRDVVNSPTKDSFAIAWLTFKDEVCGPFPLFVKYVEETVLPLKKHFVRAWTNKYLHLGCRTTNIVESAHAQSKRYLRSSVGDLASCWDEIDKMLKNQLGEIQGSFGRSITVMVHKYKKTNYSLSWRGMSLRPLWVSSMKNLNALGDLALLKKIVVVCKWQRSGCLVLVFLLRRERKNCLFFWMKYTLIGEG